MSTAATTRTTAARLADFMPSLDEDFVVISDDSPDTVSSLPLQPPAGGKADAAAIVCKIRQATEQQASLQREAMEQATSIRGVESRIRDFQRQSIESDLELQRLHHEELKHQTEVRRLADERDELLQIREDYRLLKNQYNLLVNTNERLQQEKSTAESDERQRWEEKLKAKEEQHQQELARVREEQASRLNQAQLLYSTELDTAKTDVGAKLRQELQEEIQQLEQGHREELDRLKRLQEKQQEEQKEEAESRAIELTSQLKQLEERLETEQKELQRARQQHAEALEQEQLKHKEELQLQLENLAQQRQQHREQLKEQQRQHEQQQQQLIDRHLEELERQKRDLLLDLERKRPTTVDTSCQICSSLSDCHSQTESPYSTDTSNQTSLVDAQGSKGQAPASRQESVQQDSIVRNLRMQLGSMARRMQQEKASGEEEKKNMMAKVAELRSQVKQTEETLDRERAHCGELAAKLERANSDASSLKAEVDRLREDVQKKNGELRQAEMRCQSSENSARLRESKLGETEAEAERLRGVVAQLEKRANALGDSEQNLQTQLSNAESKSARLQSELRAVESELSKATDAVRKTKDERNHLQQTLEEALHRVEKESREVKLKVAECCQLSRRAEESSAECEKLREKLRRQSDEADENFKEKSAKYDELYAAYSNLIGRHERLEDERRRLGELNDRMVNDKQQLELQRQQLIASVEALENARQQLENQLNASNAKGVESIRLAEQMKQALTQKMEEFDKIDREHSALKFEYATTRTQYRDLEEAIQRGLAREHELNEALGLHKDQLREHQQAYDSAREETRRLSEKNARMLEELEGLKAERDSLRLQKNRLLDELEQKEQQENQPAFLQAYQRR